MSRPDDIKKSLKNSEKIERNVYDHFMTCLYFYYSYLKQLVMRLRGPIEGSPNYLEISFVACICQLIYSG